MQEEFVDRRAFLETMGAAGMSSTLPEAALGLHPIDIAGKPGGNHLFMVDQKQITFMDCSQVELPFGPQFVSDIVNRTHTGQNQEQALLATELVLKAQKNATLLTFTT